MRLLAIKAKPSGLEIATATLVFREWNDAPEVGFGQPFQLVVHLPSCPLDLLTAGLQLLREPVAPGGSLQGGRDTLWVQQHRTEVAPDQFVQLAGRRKARRALRLLSAVDRLGLTGADVVGEFVLDVPPGAGGLADATTDQCSEEIPVRGVVSLSEGLIAGELALCRLEHLLANDRWDGRHRNPLLAW